MSETLIDDRAGPGPDDGEPTHDPAGAPPPAGRAADQRTTRARAGACRRAWYRFIGMPVEGWITLFVVGACVAFVFYQLGPVQHPGQQHPGRRRHGGPRVGPGLPARPPAAPGPPDRLDARLVRRLPRLHFYMVLPSLAIALLSYLIPYGIAFKLVAVSGVRQPAGRGVGLRAPQPAAVPDARRCWPWAPPPTCSTGRSRSTAATSPPRWPGSSRSRSRLSFAVLFLGVLARGSRPGGTGPGPPRCWPPPRCATSSRCSSRWPVPLVLFALQLDWSRVRWWMWLAAGRGARSGWARWPAGAIVPDRLGRAGRSTPPAALVFVGHRGGRVVAVVLDLVAAATLGPAQVPGHGAAGRGADQRVLDRALLPAPRLHDRHGLGEADQLLRLAVRRAPSWPPS